MAELSPTPELKTYKGNCHCGAFKFRINIPELTSVTECNCSICFRKGYKWIFPGADNFTIEKGGGSLRDYTFGACSIVHKVISLPWPRVPGNPSDIRTVLPHLRYGHYGEKTWWCCGRGNLDQRQHPFPKPPSPSDAKSETGKNTPRHQPLVSSSAHSQRRCP